MIPLPQEFLDLITEHVLRIIHRRLRPLRLARIDPAYVAASFPGTLPKVTFEGESVLSVRRYNVLAGYSPQPNDRVTLAPIGNGYVILGKLAS